MAFSREGRLFIESKPRSRPIAHRRHRAAMSAAMTRAACRQRIRLPRPKMQSAASRGIAAIHPSVMKISKALLVRRLAHRGKTVVCRRMSSGGAVLVAPRRIAPAPHHHAAGGFRGSMRRGDAGPRVMSPAAGISMRSITAWRSASRSGVGSSIHARPASPAPNSPLPSSD